MSRSLFLRDGETMVPSELTRGPWSDQAQHGGPVAALLAGAIDACPPATPMRVTRMTIDLLRPVPLLPLRVEARVTRAGRSVERVGATITVASTGQEVAAATAVRIRTAEVELPPGAAAAPMRLPGPETAEARPQEEARVSYISHGMELRWVSGAFDTPGPATVWFRLRHPVVEGEAPSPLQRVVAAADFGNGISAVADFTRLLYINPDLTVALHRHPRGEWVCFEARSRLEPDGMGMATCAIHDGDGEIGVSIQCLLVDQRKPPS